MKNYFIGWIYNVIQLFMIRNQLIKFIDIEDEIAADAGENARIYDPDKRPEPPGPSGVEKVEPEKPGETGTTATSGETGATGPPPEIKPEDQAKIDFFNELHGTEFTSLEDIKASDVVTKKSAVDDDSAKNTQAYLDMEKKVADLQSKYDDAIKKLNPMEHFVSQDEYIRQQLLREHPQYDPAIMSRALNKEAFDKLPPIEKIKLRMLLEDSDIYDSEEEVLEMINHEYELDPALPFNEQSTLTKNQIKKKAKEASEFFDELRSKVEVPDIEKAKADQQVTVENNAKQLVPIVNQVADQLDKIIIEDKAKDGRVLNKFEFAIDKEFAQEIRDNITDIAKGLAQNGVSPDQENLAEILVNGYKENFWKQNRGKLLSSFRKDIVTNLTEEEYNKYHNPEPPKTKTAPKQKTSEQISKEEAEAQIEADL